MLLLFFDPHKPYNNIYFVNYSNKTEVSKKLILLFSDLLIDQLKNYN